MNERIDEIAFLAGCNIHMYRNPKHPDLNGWIISQEVLDKFAELIVQECASICYNSSFQDADAHAQSLLYEFNIDNCRSEK